jgi:hypothetical protein
MKKVGVVIFFDHRANFIDGGLNIPEKSELLTFYIIFFDESTTYDEMVRMLIQEGRLLPFDDPRLRYNLVLQAFEASWRGIPMLPRSLSKPVTLREGQTLASTHLTHLAMDESEFNRYHLQRRINALFCATSIEIRDVPPQKDFWASPTVSMIDFISAIITIALSPLGIIQLLTIVSNSWSKTQSTAEPDIIAIRLQMTDRTQHRFEEWLTDPDRLKQYIDVFNQPSSSVKPLQAIFVLKKDGPIIIDVSEGAQSNLQLDEVLSYLHVDSAGK